MEIFKCQKCQKIVKIIQQGYGQLYCCEQKMFPLSFFENIQSILEFAIEKEQDAQNFYLLWAKKINNENMAELFKEFAVEESRHREKLEKIKQNRQLSFSHSELQNLRISDFLEDAEISEDIDYQDALLIAIKREKISIKLYSRLASLAESPEIASVFKFLIQEEQKHKEKLETEYEKIFLREN